MTTLYPWQQPAWQTLQAYLAQGRIPQALLVSGPAGIGRRHLLDYYARALLCETPAGDASACGRCHACLLVAAGTHPDYLSVEPDEPGKAIGIDKIRHLIAKLALKPQYDRTYRMVILSPAELLNTASANAFLKCLEEPTERTCLLLLTEQPGRLPATIRSRCQKLYCPLPPKALALEWLAGQGILTDAEPILELARGAPLLAGEYAQRNIAEYRQRYFQDWLAIVRGQGNPLAVAEQWQKGEPVELAVALTWMAQWVADIIRCAHVAEPADAADPDMKNALQALSKRLELQGLYRFYDALLLAKSQLATQMNRQLLVEQLLIRWSQLNPN